METNKHKRRKKLQQQTLSVSRISPPVPPAVTSDPFLIRTQQWIRHLQGDIWFPPERFQVSIYPSLLDWELSLTPTLDIFHSNNEALDHIQDYQMQLKERCNEQTWIMIPDLGESCLYFPRNENRRARWVVAVMRFHPSVVGFWFSNRHQMFEFKRQLQEAIKRDVQLCNIVTDFRETYAPVDATGSESDDDSLAHVDQSDSDNNPTPRWPVLDAWFQSERIFVFPILHMFWGKLSNETFNDSETDQDAHALSLMVVYLSMISSSVETTWKFVESYHATLLLRSPIQLSGSLLRHAHPVVFVPHSSLSAVDLCEWLLLGYHFFHPTWKCLLNQKDPNTFPEASKKQDVSVTQYPWFIFDPSLSRTEILSLEQAVKQHPIMCDLLPTHELFNNQVHWFDAWDASFLSVRQTAPFPRGDTSHVWTQLREHVKTALLHNR